VATSRSQAARRRTWDHRQTSRFDRTELAGRLYVGMALAVMVLVLLSALTTSTQPLQRAQERQVQQTRTSPPPTSSAAARPAGSSSAFDHAAAWSHRIA
jgi:hypothetical protein